MATSLLEVLDNKKVGTEKVSKIPHVIMDKRLKFPLKLKFYFEISGVGWHRNWLQQHAFGQGSSG